MAAPPVSAILPITLDLIPGWKIRFTGIGTTEYFGVEVKHGGNEQLVTWSFEVLPSESVDRMGWEGAARAARDKRLLFREPPEWPTDTYVVWDCSDDIGTLYVDRGGAYLAGADGEMLGAVHSVWPAPPRASARFELSFTGFRASEGGTVGFSVPLPEL